MDEVANELGENMTTVLEAFLEWSATQSKFYSEKHVKHLAIPVLRNFARAYGHLDVNRVDESHIYEFVNGPKHLKFSSRSRYLAAISGFMKWVRGKGYIERKGAPESVVKVDHRALPPELMQSKMIIPINDQEYDTLMINLRNLLSKTNRPARLVDMITAVQIIEETGLRIGDVLSMRWSQVGSKTLIVFAGKTGKRIPVPITDKLASVLSEVRRPGLFVFGEQDQSDYSQEKFRDSFSCVASRILGRRVGFHNLRHRYVARCKAIGIIPQHIMGHSTIQQTMDYGTNYETERDHPLFGGQP